MHGGKAEPLTSVYEHDPEMADIVAMFVAEMPDRSAELRSACEAGDLEAALTIAHQLKGAAGGYGFEHLGDIAASAESSLKSLRSAHVGLSAGSLLAAAGPLLEALSRVRLSVEKAA
jgi:HPt (histidine-containing phosphotransfer) domain-containing protein